MKTYNEVQERIQELARKHNIALPKEATLNGDSSFTVDDSFTIEDEEEYASYYWEQVAVDLLDVAPDETEAVMLKW